MTLCTTDVNIVNILFMAPRMVYCNVTNVINLLWSLMSKLSTTFQSVSYGSRRPLPKATGHSVSMKNTKILTRESNWHKRKVKEAIYIRQ